MLHAFILPGLGPQETLLIAILGILLFGKKLPEVGRSVGKGLVEFKKGLRGLEDELDAPARPASKTFTRTPSVGADSYAADAPKFVPPSSPPASSTSGLTEFETNPYGD